MPTMLRSIFIISFVIFTGYLKADSDVIDPKDFKTSNKQQLVFKENKGQVSDQFFKPRTDVLFSGADGKFVFHLKRNGISYQLNRVDKWKEDVDSLLPPMRKRIGNQKIPEQTTTYRLDVEWLNTNPNTTILRGATIEGYDNYYSESCPNGALEVKSFKQITYQKLYSGIDLKWYEKNGNLKYDFIVSANSDYKQIQLKIDGAEKISINQNGELVIETPIGELIEQSPLVTQNNKALKAKWKIKNNIVSFDIENVNPSLPLIIDPLVRFWGTYFGGPAEEDWAANPFVDVFGNVFYAGNTKSNSNIATIGAHQTVYGGTGVFFGDAFLVKFDAVGNRLWATYYGGSSNEHGDYCFADANGNVFLVGGTDATNSLVIATPGAHQTIPSLGGAGGGANDGFLVKFNASGIRQWGTFYGGIGWEYLICGTIDLFGNIYVCGSTGSLNGTTIATLGSHQSVYGGGNYDAFLVKFNSSGVRLWGTYYGGNALDDVVEIDTDPLGNIYMCGSTSSANGTAIGTLGSYQANYGGYIKDAYLVKFNSMGVRQWGTYYGGNGSDYGYSCKLYNNSVYIGGSTTSNMSNIIATPGSHQMNNGGGAEAFVAKFDLNGIRQWGTFYGGAGTEDWGYATTDVFGNVYLSGRTSTSGGTTIATPCTYQDAFGGGPKDVFLAKFDSSGVRQWGTYYGGMSDDSGLYCTTDSFGNIYLTGITSSSIGTTIADVGGYQPTYGGGISDAFLVKFSGCVPVLLPNSTSLQNLTICHGENTSLTTSVNCQVNWYDSPGGNIIGTTSTLITPTLTSGTSTFYIADASCGTTNILTSVIVTVNPLPLISINIPSVILCYASSVNLIASGATSYSWSPETSISCVFCSDPIASPTKDIIYCVRGEDNNQCIAKACSTIEVNSNSNDFSLPNAFTPNADGINDSFCLQGWDRCLENFHIMIFDRWGEKVFESNEPTFCWDGIYKGQMLSADVYVYRITAKYLDETEVNKKGNITLIR